MNTLLQNSQDITDETVEGEVYAAIGMAIHQYMNDTVHDLESYIITIKRKRYYEVI